MVEPHSSNFRVITTNILGVRIFRKFTVYTRKKSQKVLLSPIKHMLLTNKYIFLSTFSPMLGLEQKHKDFYNVMTHNNCFVKGSHKYDVYLFNKNKAHVN